MRKLKLLCLLPSLCLMSCSSSTYSGVYEFRLGKTDGAHFSLSVELTDDAYEKRNGMKKMFMAADLGSDYSIETMIKQYEEEYPFIASSLQKVLEVLPEDHRIDAYYTITEIKHSKYGYRVKIGSDFVQEVLEKAFPDYIKELEEFIDLVFPGKTISTITEPEIVQLIACAYADGKNFTVQIPVSADDLYQQLAWYGYLVDKDANNMFNTLDLEKMPGPKGDARYGVHPATTKDEKGNVVSSEVDMVNQTFVYEFSHTYLYQDDEFGIPRAVGSFITIPDENNLKGLYFKPFDPAMPTALVEGKLQLHKGEVLESFVNVKFGVSPRDKEVVVQHNGKSGAEEGIIFPLSDNLEVTFKSFMMDPFVFRDFHDVNVGLTKV